MAKITVLEITTHEGKGYVVTPSMWTPAVANPLLARNYEECEDAHGLYTIEHDMSVLHVDGDHMFAKSGLQTLTEPVIVSFEMELKEVGRKPGRRRTTQ